MSDNEDNFGFLAADDAHYAPYQRKVYEQLIDSEGRLELELQQFIAKKKKLLGQKEQIGVRLYNAQQQLASNQMNYEKAHDNYNIAQRLRIESEQKLAQVNEVYNSKKEQLSILKNQVTKAQKQLENLMRHFHEIEAYNIQLKSDIAVTKIETFTAEQNVSNLEKIKKKQDLLIDSMNEQSKRLEQQKNILAAQIISQKQETQEAKKILRQAQDEMDKVTASKKNLLERWQKSIMFMQKKDSALQIARDTLKHENQINILLLNEISGIKSQIRKEQELTEKLTFQSTRITAQKNSLEIKKNQLLDEENKISSNLVMLKQSLRDTEDQIAKSEQEKKNVENAMHLIQNNVMKLHTQTKRLLQSLINQKSQHTTIQKTASNLLKQAHQLEFEIQQKQIELENLQNEIARVKIDQLNTKSQIELLEGKKQQKLTEQNQKKYLVITYEVQIRQGHDINEKKQHQVGRLNKLHDQLMSKANDQGKNPLENKLINFIRQTEELENNCNELYRDWIKKQTNLVKQNNILQKVKENVTDLQNKKMIMQQKKSRLNNNYKSFQREITDIKIGLKGLQQEMNKLNDNLAVHSGKKQKLQNENVNLQSQFVEKLKEMEREAIKLEINIDKIREEKADLMNQIVQYERQILLWERKYQLQKEMQDALDPNVGQSQIEELKKQLHRMQLKYASLTKQKDKIVTEMIRTVNNKDTIMLKYQSIEKRQSSGVKKVPQTSNQMKKSISQARKKQGKIMKSLQEIERTLAKKQQQLQNIGQALEGRIQDQKKLENQNHQLQTQTVMSKLKRLTDVLKLAVLQKKYKKLDDIGNKTAKLMYQEQTLRDKLEQVKDKNEGLFRAIDQLKDKYPQYGGLLEPILEIHNLN